MPPLSRDVTADITSGGINRQPHPLLVRNAGHKRLVSSENAHLSGFSAVQAQLRPVPTENNPGRWEPRLFIAQRKTDSANLLAVRYGIILISSNVLKALSLRSKPLEVSKLVSSRDTQTGEMRVSGNINSVVETTSGVQYFVFTGGNPESVSHPRGSRTNRKGMNILLLVSFLGLLKILALSRGTRRKPPQRRPGVSLQVFLLYILLHPQ